MNVSDNDVQANHECEAFLCDLHVEVLAYQKLSLVLGSCIYFQIPGHTWCCCGDLWRVKKRAKPESESLAASSTRDHCLREMFGQPNPDSSLVHDI
jgi:hypothetical protein